MKNLFWIMVFLALPAYAQLKINNPNTDLKEGETAEYTTLRTMFEGNNPSSNILLGVGESFPSIENKVAHEVFVLIRENQSIGVQSAPSTGTAMELGVDSPLTFSVFASVYPDSAYEKIYDEPGQAGKVLWNFRIDKTGNAIKRFHNAYNTTDDSATNTLFDAAVDLRKPRANFANIRTKLLKYIPALSNESIWNQFRTSSLGTKDNGTELETTWLQVMRERGMKAAAFVIEGSLLNINHFRVTNVHKTKPGGLPLSVPKDYQLENNNETSDWTIVGIVVDPDSDFFPKVQPAMEAFGQGIHFHGLRTDGQKVGHVMNAVLSDKPLRVRLYPLSIGSDLGISNNDVIVSKDGALYSIENKGANFIRNLKYTIKAGNRVIESRDVVEVIPNQKIQVSLQKGQCLEVDPEKILLEGGSGRNNNKICAK